MARDETTDPSDLRVIAIIGTGLIVCGCIWTPPDCNVLICSGAEFAIADVYPASLCGSILRRREPRWISARFLFNAPEASATAVPVHTSGSESDGSDPFTIPSQVAAIT